MRPRVIVTFPSSRNISVKKLDCSRQGQAFEYRGAMMSYKNYDQDVIGSWGYYLHLLSLRPSKIRVGRLGPLQLYQQTNSEF